MTVSLPDSSSTSDSAMSAALVGLRAAWRTPSVIARDIAVLLAPPAALPKRRAAEAIIAVRVAHKAIAILARVYPTRWRATCLYRSVAECLALRTLGLPARLVIGVGNGAAPAATIAHAWVECEGVQCRSTRGAAELETLAASRA
jgi:Transglutaminase-like superfamily